MFLEAKLYNLEGSTSDHIPIFLMPKQKVEQSTHSQRLRFENAWLTEPMCGQLIKEG